MNKKRYKWAAAGDVNAFFGLMLDNIAGMVLAVSLLAIYFDFPADFALRYMIPGTAIGVLVGDLMFFVLAFLLAKRTGRNDVTAMPLGLDTPSTIGMVFFVLGPAYADAIKQGLATDGAAMLSWHIGICSIVITGLIKLVFAFASGMARRILPRAGLLGSLAAIALVLIAFIPLLKAAAMPIVAFSSLAIVLVTLIARGKLPFKIPGAAGAVMVGCAVYYSIMLIEYLTGYALNPDTVTTFNPGDAMMPTDWLTVFSFEWVNSMQDALAYLPYIIPFAITTVIGGIDCAESAASAGDDYPTGAVIGVEAIATIIAGFCGGVIQTTPYIGHPAYKAMGGRALYTLLTALFIGAAGVLGFFAYILLAIPEAALLPILIFIGIEITAQSYQVTPKRHYAALAIACLPAIAKLLSIKIGAIEGVLVGNEISLSELATQISEENQLIHILAGGFIITSLLWASATAKIVDRRLKAASVYFLICAVFTLFGVMHSPLAGDKMFLLFGFSKGSGWHLAIEPDELYWVLQFSSAYLAMAVVMFGLGLWQKNSVKPIDSDDQFEMTE